MNTQPEVSDRRLHARMFRTLHNFQDGGVSLHDLIDNLKTSAAQLQSADEPWKNEFDGLVSELEYARDTSIESGLSSEAFRRVKNVVKDLELMVFEARTWTDQEKETLRKIIEVHSPDLLHEFDDGMSSGFEPNRVKDIRNAVRAELKANGVTNGEVNEWGKICEDFIERIRPVAAQK